MLIFLHGNNQTLLPIYNLRLDLRRLLRFYPKHHIVGLCLRNVVIDLLLLLDADAFASLNDVKNVIIDEYRRELIGEGQMFYVYKRLCSPSILWHSTNVSEADYVVKLPLTK